MLRRNFTFATLIVPVAGSVTLSARAGGIDSIGSAEATQGLKAALERGATAAVQLLGKTDGFLGNPKVRIPLPDAIRDASKLLKAMGRGKQVEELEVAINRAAEQAVPLARDLLVGAVRGMTVNDARQILTGGDTSVTTFFASKTRPALTDRFLPVVSKVVARVGLAEKYDQLAGKASSMGLVRKEDATMEQYVTRKALDGLFLAIGEEERNIRRDPLGTGSALLGKVFGALK